MPYGVRLSQDLREVVLYMRTMLTNSKIIEYTGLPKTTVNSIIRVYNTTGRIGNSPEPGKKAPPTSRSKLSEGDVDVSPLYPLYMTLIDWFQYILTVLNNTPAIYLEDIRLMLKGVGVEVHTSTIWRTLKRRNYSMKTVSFSSPLSVSFTHAGFSPWKPPRRLILVFRTSICSKYRIINGVPSFLLMNHPLIVAHQSANGHGQRSAIEWLRRSHSFVGGGKYKI